MEIEVSVVREIRFRKWTLIRYTRREWKPVKGYVIYQCEKCALVEVDGKQFFIPFQYAHTRGDIPQKDK